MRSIAARHKAEHCQCGRHVFVVCTGKECRRRGALKLLRELEEACAGGDAGIRIAPASCLGHCGLAPAVMEDGELVGVMSSRRLRLEITRLGLARH